MPRNFVLFVIMTGVLLVLVVLGVLWLPGDGKRLDCHEKFAKRIRMENNQSMKVQMNECYLLCVTMGKFPEK